MILENLTIHFEVLRKNHFVGFIPALFNPSQLAYSKSVQWAPILPPVSSRSGLPYVLQYQSSQPETLSLELFFDSYGMDIPMGVRAYTEALVALARVQPELHRPPACILRWGKNPLFLGVLQQVSRTYVLFLEDGTPVRATMQCVFAEVPVDISAAVELHSPDVAKTYIVRPGDTLMSIAAALYGDGGQWRRIADANRIEDPRRLTPGRTLSIPRIR